MRRYAISTDRADILLRSIIDNVGQDLTIKSHLDWRGNVIFFISGGDIDVIDLPCVIRQEEVQIDEDGVAVRMSPHDGDFFPLEGHDVVEFFAGSDYATGVFLPRELNDNSNSEQQDTPN